MIVSNDFDDNACDTLTEKLIMLTDKDASLSHREILLAHIGAIGNTLASISCKDCREIAAKLVKSAIPDAVSDALDFADEHQGGQPPISGHVH